jgi:hypothetical protein
MPAFSFDSIAQGDRDPPEQKPVLSTSIDDATFGQIVRREFNRNRVTGEDADVVFAHLPGDVRNHRVAVLELHSERRVWKCVNDTSFHLNGILFRHALLRIGL